MLMLPGWAESEGVQIEICIAEALGIPARYMEVPSVFSGLTAGRSTELHRAL